MHLEKLNATVLQRLIGQFEQTGGISSGLCKGAKIIFFVSRRPRALLFRAMQKEKFCPFCHSFVAELGPQRPLPRIAALCIFTST